MSNFDKHVLAFSPHPYMFRANSTIQRLQSIRKIINFWYTFGWKWWVISFCDYLGLSDACSYDVDDVIGRADRFGFQNFCSPVCMCVYVNIFKHLPLWNYWADWSQISYEASLGWWNKSLFKWFVHICPYMVKTSKNLPRNQKADDWNFVWNIGCSGTTRFVQMMNLGWPWPFLWQGQIWSHMLLYGKKVKQWIFQKLLSSMIWNGNRWLK